MILPHLTAIPKAQHALTMANHVLDTASNLVTTNIAPGGIISVTAPTASIPGPENHGVEAGKPVEMGGPETFENSANWDNAEMIIDDRGDKGHKGMLGSADVHDEKDDDGEDEEVGFVDGVPKNMPEYLESIWEYLVGVSAAEDWECAMKLWAKFERDLGYPQGRVRSYVHY